MPAYILYAVLAYASITHLPIVLLMLAMLKLNLLNSESLQESLAEAGQDFSKLIAFVKSYLNGEELAKQAEEEEIA